MRYQIKSSSFSLRSFINPCSTVVVHFYFMQSSALGPILSIKKDYSSHFLSLLFLDVGSIIYLVFYRRECRVWPKLLMLFTGTIPTYTSMLIYNDSPIYTIGDPLPTGWTNLALILILLLFAAIALAAIIWLIIAMVKYPKPASKPA